jgi:uncharacterized protein YukE
MPVHIDPEETRIFASQLKKFSQTLSESLQRTQGQMGQLGETWKDAEYEQFRQVFAKTYPLIQQFVQESERTIPSLIRHADDIDEYLRMKPE